MKSLYRYLALAGAFAAAYTVTTLILMVCVRKIHAKA